MFIIHNFVATNTLCYKKYIIYNYTYLRNTKFYRKIKLLILWKNHVSIVNTEILRRYIYRATYIIHSYKRICMININFI